MGRVPNLGGFRKPLNDCPYDRNWSRQSGPLLLRSRASPDALSLGAFELSSGVAAAVSVRPAERSEVLKLPQALGAPQPLEGAKRILRALQQQPDPVQIRRQHRQRQHPLGARQPPCQHPER